MWVLCWHQDRLFLTYATSVSACHVSLCQCAMLFIFSHVSPVLYRVYLKCLDKIGELLIHIKTKKKFHMDMCLEMGGF